MPARAGAGEIGRSDIPDQSSGYTDASKIYWALDECFVVSYPNLRYSPARAVRCITAATDIEGDAGMQQALRPYATAGIALVGASMIAVTPMVVPPPAAQVRSVRLVDAWSDLVTNTTANLDSIVSNASSSDITQLFNELVTNPFGVIEAFANFDPTVTTDLTSIPATISVELPPGLELAIAGLGATGATLTTLETVAQQLQTDPSLTNLSEGLATVLNAYLNGTDNVSLLDGAITIPLYNGLLAPETSANIDINLPDLINALGLGNTPLTDLDLSSLLSQLGLGDLTLGSLFSDLGLSDQGLGTVLAGLTDPITTLGGLLNLLGLDGLDLPSLSLTNILSGLGLDTNVDLSTLSLNTVLETFGINPTIATGLPGLLDTLLGSDAFTSEGLGSVISTLPTSLINGVLDPLNGTLGTLLDPLLSVPVLGPLLTTALSDAGLNFDSLLDASNLETALNGITIGDLLGAGPSIDATVSTLLGDLGVSVPNDLTIGGILGDLGFSSATTGQLTLGDLLGDLGTVANPILGLDITDLLNGLNLGNLLGDLGLSDLPLDLSNLGDLSGLTLSDLLGDLGLGDLANVSVEPLGGFDTLLVDLVPQQILASLGM